MASKTHRKEARGLSTKAKIIGLAVGSSLVARVIVTSLAASHGDQSIDAAAADYASTSEAAASAAAEQRVQNGDPAGAMIFARQGLSASSISASSLRSLALAEQQSGHGALAAALFAQAAALGWRDIPTQFWLFQAFMQQGDDVQAVERLDAVLRISDEPQTLFPSLDLLITDKKFADALIGRLVENPAWRRAYFMATDNIGPDALLARADILLRLIRSPAPPTRDEVRLIVTRLILARHAREARSLWLATQHLPANTTILDPNFSHAATFDTVAFEWTLLPLPGASTSIASPPDVPGLEVTSDGTTAGPIARQLIILPSGDHALSYTGAIPASAREAFQWVIRCADNNRTILEQTLSISNFRFSVPAGCEGQQVELRARNNPSSSSNTATFSGIRIE